MSRTPFSRRARKLFIFALTILALSGCEQTLVYGERTGFNLSIVSDPAKSSPIEVNAGLKRSVVGLIPPEEEAPDGEPSGEAVNMFSRFNLRYDEISDGLFGGKLTISSAFASGKAAINVAGKKDVVESIVNPTGFRISDDPEVRGAVEALGNFIAIGLSNVEQYLGRALLEGLDIAKGPTLRARAIKTIDNPINGQGNIRIAKDLDLIS